MKELLDNKIGLPVLVNEPLRNYTTFKIGGPAKFFVKVNNAVDLQKALNAAMEFKLPFFILGGGSNVLVSDKGFDGLVIRLESAELAFEGNKVRVFGGNNWSDFVRKTIDNGLTGLEFGANIPGTVGGAIYGNAGAYGQGVGDYVFEIEIISYDTRTVGTEQCSAPTVRVLSKNECVFGYRDSIFKKNKDWVIAEATFELKTDANSQEKFKKIKDEYEIRCASQPLNFPSAGCSFKNVVYNEELAKFKEWEVKGKLPAARFIEEADLKGMKIGGAMVSDKHANFIINFNNAKADDVVQLISLVKTRVRNEFGVQLEEEIQYIGF
ncbi:MAG: UDP-N-acetylmuramate dehydrogenase [Patescibacteria group bacterium]